jgi:hypothetical protein
MLGIMHQLVVGKLQVLKNPKKVDKFINGFSVP